MRKLLLLPFLFGCLLFQAVECPNSHAAVPSGSGSSFPAQDTLKNMVEQFVNSSGLKQAVQDAVRLQQEATGKGVPVLGDVGDPFAAGVENRVKAAVEQASAVAGVVRKICGPSALAFYYQLTNNPVFAQMPEVNFTFYLPSTGQVTLRRFEGRTAVYVSATASGSSVVVGISNADPLCPVRAGRMENKNKTATGFLDLAGPNDAYLQVRAPLGGNGPPQVTGRSLLAAGGKGIELSFGAIDPLKAKMEGSLSVGLKAALDNALSAEAGAEGEIAFEVSPARGAEITAGAARAMAAEAGRLSVNLDGRPAPDRIVPVIQAGLQYLSQYKSADQDALGEVSIGTSVSAELGVGFGDTKIPGVSTIGSLSVSLPAEKVMNVGTASISKLLSAGLTAAPVSQKLGSAVLLGDQAAASSLAAEIERIAAGVLNDAVTEIARAAGDTTLELGYSVNLAGKDGGGDKAGTSCKVYGISARIPLGKTPDTALAGQTIGQTIRAMASLVKQMAPLPTGSVAGGVTIDWEAAAQATAEGATFTITTSPGVPLVNITAKLPARALLLAMQEQDQAVGFLLRGLVRGVQEKSLAALRNEYVASLFGGQGDAPAELRKNTTFGISLGGGTSGQLGLEAGVVLGRGASLYAETNPEMLFLFGRGYDRPDVVGQASMGLGVVSKLNGEISLGEGVEVSAGGGGQTAFEVFYLNFQEKDRPPAPSSVTVAGFTVTGFQGTVNADGSFSGSGQLQLPGGDSVHAVFSVNTQQHVVSGSFSGAFMIGGRQFSVLSGLLSDDGLSWTERVNFGAFGTADVNCILSADGNFSASGYLGVNIAGTQKQFAVTLSPGSDFTGTYSGSLTVGLRSISDVNLTLSNSGITGTGRINLAGSQQTFNLSVNASGQVAGAYTGAVSVAGRQVSSTFTLAPDGTISCGGGLQVSVGGVSRKFAVVVDSQGNVTGTYSGSLSVGSRSISDANLTLSNSGITGTGRINLAGSRQIFNLSVNESGQVCGAYTGAVSVAGRQVSGTFTLAPDGTISCDSVVQVSVGGASKNFLVTIDSQGNVTGTYSGSLTAGPRSISDANLTLSNSGIKGTGNVALLGSRVNFSLAVDSAGRLSGSAKNISFTAGLPEGKSVSIAASGNLTLSSDGAISGSGTVNAGNTSIKNARFIVDANGNVTGNGSVSVGSGSISCAFNLSSGSFSISGSTTRSKSITVGIPPLVQTYTFNATVSLGVKNTNEIKATASGKVNNVTVGSAEVNLGSGEVTVGAFGLNLTFDLF